MASKRRHTPSRGKSKCYCTSKAVQVILPRLLSHPATRHISVRSRRPCAFVFVIYREGGGQAINHSGQLSLPIGIWKVFCAATNWRQPMMMLPARRLIYRLRSAQQSQKGSARSKWERERGGQIESFRTQTRAPQADPTRKSNWTEWIPGYLRCSCFNWMIKKWWYLCHKKIKVAVLICSKILKIL